jgi:hypothetical protein
VDVEDDCLADFFLVDLLSSPIFSSAFKFPSVRRARFEGLSELFSIDLSSPRFRVPWVYVCGGQEYSSTLEGTSAFVDRA